MKRLAVLCFVLSIFALPSAQCLADAVTNGDFSGGLTAWTSMGAVDASSGAAVLSDTDSMLDGYASLYQGVALAPGDYVLDFDFSPALTAQFGQDMFPDTFFATLYFVDDLSQFDLASLSFDDALNLADLDAGSADYHGATITSSRSGWLHYELQFSSAYHYVIPTFELWNLNGTLGDSGLSLDNVKISSAVPVEPVPEPASVILLGSALCSGIFLGRARR